MITSVSNERVKHAKSLARKKGRLTHRQFLVEGTRIIEEAERAGIAPALVFFEPKSLSADARARRLFDQLRRRTEAVYEVSEVVQHALAETETPQSIFAVYAFPDLPLTDAPGFVLLLDSLRDPGNLGTILRTAWAAGVDQVLLSPGAADPLNPKVVRAAMGAHFFLPIASLAWEEIYTRLESIPRIYLAEADGELDYAQADWSRPCALIVGGEAEGASDQARRIATARISIPMPGRAESLNAAVAAGILLFEAARSQKIK